MAGQRQVDSVSRHGGDLGSALAISTSLISSMITQIAIFQRPHSTMPSCVGILVPAKIASPCHRGGKEEYLGSV